MKKYIVILAILSICCHSCQSNSDEPTVNQAEIPEPLEGKVSVLETSSSRSGDLVQHLYDDLVKRDEQLKRIEKQLKNLREFKNDSLEVFYKFSGNNNSYYDAALNYSSHIPDSSLKHQMDTLIQESLEKYKTLMAAHREEEKKIELNDSTITNLHLALIIMKTVPIMEKYQKDNIPPIKPLQDFKSRQADMIKSLQNVNKK